MFQQEYGYPMADFDSESENSLSSEDEIDIVLRGTPEQKRKLAKQAQGQQSSSEDEFEKEMRLELDGIIKTTMNRAENASAPPQDSSKTKPQSQAKTDDSKFELDDDDDDDDDDGDSSLRQHLKNIATSNKMAESDDPFYDPEMDDVDQRSVDKQRRKYQPRLASGVKPLPKSDAVLNCPGCMSLLCLDCQRHETYKNQYRAMFVSNCSVIYDEVLQQPLQKTTKRKKKLKTEEPMQAAAADSETYHPVRCSICNTEVAMFDNDEVFHFFNVLSSHG